MESERALLSQIQEKYDFDVERFVFMRKVDISTSQSKKSERFLMCTLFSGYIYKSQIFSKSLKYDGSFSWDTVKKITSTEKGSFSIILLNGDYTIFSNEADDLLQMIINNIQMIFSITEQPTLTITTNLKLVPPNQDLAPVIRFLFKCRLFGRKPSEETVKSYSQYVENNHHAADKGKYISFDIEHVTDGIQYADLLFDSLEVDTYIKTIIIPPIKNGSLWISLANFLQKNASITSIVAKDKLNEDFQAIIQSLSQNPNSKLVSLSFLDTTIDKDQIKVFEQLMIAHPFRSFNFSKSFSLGTYKAFAKTIPNVPNYSHLRFLTISNMKGVNPKLIIMNLPKLVRLDFSNNEVDITHTLMELSNLKRSKLQHLDCSGNFCLYKPPLKMNLPKKLQIVIAKQVNWVGNNFLSFMKIMSRNAKRNQNMMEIDVSDAKVDLTAWLLFFQRLPAFPIINLVSFDFSRNPVMDGLFKFLEQSTSIATLTLDGCFEANDENIPFFIEFLEKCFTIKRLSFSGTQDKKLGIGAAHVLRSLEKKEIQFLDIQNNAIQDDLFDYLSKLCDSCPTLSEINIDNNNFASVDSLEYFIDFARQRNYQLILQIPKQDLSALSAQDRHLRASKLAPLIKDIKSLRNLPKFKIPKKKGLAKGTQKGNTPKANAQKPSIKAQTKRNNDGEEEEEPESPKTKNRDDLGLFSSSSSDESENEQNDNEQAGEEESADGDESSPSRSPSMVELASDIKPDELDNLPVEPLSALDKWAIIGKPEWMTVEQDFINDSKFFSQYRFVPLPNEVKIKTMCQQDFAFSSLSNNLRSKSSV